MSTLLFREWQKDKDFLEDGILSNLYSKYTNLISNIRADDNATEQHKLHFASFLNDINDSFLSFKKDNLYLYNKLYDCFKKYKTTKGEKLIREIENDKELEGYYHDFCNAFSSKEKLNLLKGVNFGKISEVNSMLTKRGNPLFNLKKDYKSGKILIDTYSYAAEFKIPYNKNEFLKIKIEPRDLIGKNKFKEMLFDIFDIGYIDSISGKEDSNEYIELFYNTFLTKLNNTLNSGVYREYNEKEENLRSLRGSIMVYRNYCENRINKSKIYCRYDEYNDNNIINRTLAKTLHKISRSYLGHTMTIQTNANNLLNSFFDDYVSLLSDFKENHINTIIYNKQNQRYKEIIKYCINILRNIGGTFDTENQIDYDAFYIDLSTLFESYIGKRLQTYDESYVEQLSNKIKEANKIKDCKGGGNIDDYIKQIEEHNYNVELQYDREFLDDHNVFRIKPDIILFDNNNKPILVADTKYKKLIDNNALNYNIDSNDIYQVLAYAQKFQTNIAILIYPMPEKEVITPVFKIGDILLYIWQVNLRDNCNL